MMTKLRENTAIIMWFVIFAFLGLIVVEWGMDYSGSSSTGAGDTVGTINGTKVSIQQFRQEMQVAAQQQQSSDDADQLARLVRETWNNLVQRVLVSQEIERLGIQITDEELAYYTQNKPPAEVQNIEAFQTDGEFDPVLYGQFITDRTTYTNPGTKDFVRNVEQILRQRMLFERLRRIIIETAQVSPSAVRQYYAERNEKVKVEFLFASGSTIGDDEVSLDESDMEAYYQEHIDEYQHPEQIRVSTVFLPSVPTAEDSLDIAEEIKLLRQEIEAGTDFAQLAEAVSEDKASAANGGDLGTFGRGSMVKTFEEAAFALKAGEVSEPVLTLYGWHLIKVEEHLEEDGEAKVRARHILLRFKPSRQTEEALQDRVEEFVALAGERGFQAAAQIDSLPVQNSGYLNKDMVVPTLGVGTTWLVNLFFDSEIGTIRRGGNDRGAWVAILVERRLEGVASLDEVRSQIERKMLNLRKADIAGQQLEQIRQQVLNGDSLEQAAAELELRQPEPFSRSASVAGVGRRNAFIGAAFQLQVGELSEVITLPQGSYLLRVVEQIPIDEDKFQVERGLAAQALMSQRQNEAWQAWSTQLYDSAEIEDNRHLFYVF